MKSWIAVMAALLFAPLAVAHTVELRAKLNGAPRPEIVGTTSLPDGTKLATDLVCPLVSCASLWEGEGHAMVKDGVFISKPFEKDGLPLPHGEYVINVVILADQEPDVAAKLADLGWNRYSIFAFHFKDRITFQGMVTAAPQTENGRILRAEAAVSDDMHDPSKVKLMECTGIKVYEDPQPAGHPPSREQCLEILRESGGDPSMYAPIQ